LTTAESLVALSCSAAARVKDPLDLLNTELLNLFDSGKSAAMDR